MSWRTVAGCAALAVGLWMSHPGQTTITIPDHITITHDVSGAIQLAPGTLSIDVAGIPAIPQLVPDHVAVDVHASVEATPEVRVTIEPTP